MFWDFNQKEIGGLKFYGYNKSDWLGTEILLVDFSFSKSLESEWWRKI